MTFLLANWKLVLLVLLVAAVGIQTGRITLLKSEYAKEAAERATAEAQERARIAHNAQEALDALQTRLNTVATRYKRLRESGSAPSLASLAPKLEACPGEPSQPDATARFLERLEGGVEEIVRRGDEEIAKYVELWTLQQKNASGSKLEGVAAGN